MKSSTWHVTGLPLTMCRMNIQRHRKFGLAALFSASVPGACFMVVKGHTLSDQSDVRRDSTPINQSVPIA